MEINFTNSDEERPFCVLLCCLNLFHCSLTNVRYIIKKNLHGRLSVRVRLCLVLCFLYHIVFFFHITIEMSIKRSTHYKFRFGNIQNTNNYYCTHILGFSCSYYFIATLFQLSIYYVILLRWSSIVFK